MLIVQLSDTHITASGTRAYGVASMAENLARCVQHINQMLPPVDVVLVNGDISNSGHAEELAHTVRLLDKLLMPYYVIPGNHDDRAAMWSSFGGRACPSRAGGYLNYVIDDYDLRLIALDSTVQGESGGEICEHRAAWLDARLGEDTNKPVLIFMHHPPVKFGVIETDVDGFVGVDRLAGVIKKYAHIEAILCGHIHLSAHTRWCGTEVSTAPSIGMQLVLDLTLQHEAFTLESPAYLLHYWTPEQNLITHSQRVDAGDGPYPFKQQSIQ